MREHGSVTELPEARPSDHLCWVHDDDATFDVAVRAFLAGGLDRGERLLCIGARAIASLDDAAAVLGDVAALRADGTLETMTIPQAYAAVGPLAVARQRAFYDEATQRALAAGYQGLRVVAEMTELAADPGLLDELVRWEHAADEFMATGAGMSAMCAYRSDLPRAALSAALAAHPMGRAAGHLSSYRVFFDEGRVVLAGSVDTFTADALAVSLAAVPVGTHPVLDVVDLQFVDVAGCRTLAAWAAALHARGLPLQFLGASALLERMWTLLGFAEVAPVTFAPAGADPRPAPTEL